MTGVFERLKNNDKDAWAELYKHNADRIYRYVYARCDNNVYVAEEITQKVFLTAIDRIETFSGNEDKLSNWLFGIARVKILEQFRRKDRVMDYTVPLDETVTGKIIAEAETDIDMDFENMLVDGILSDIPESQSRALLYKYCEGLSVNDIALKMERSLKSVESLLSRGREAFKKLYATRWKGGAE